MPTTDISANGLVINKLSKAQYDAIQNPSDTELYLVPDEIDNAPTSGSNNPVKSGGVYSALGNKQDNLVFNTAYNATSNKVATMADISNFVQKSSTSGLIKNDGTIDTNSYLTSHQDISNYIQKSDTSGLIRNDGTIDTTAYTTNTGTITGITMNGSSKGTSGVVDLGTVITDVSGKANDSEVVHNTGTEQISGQKSFNNRVNFLGTGDANAIYLTTDTRIDVNGTSYTILGFASGTFLINHTNYNLKLRGKGTRPAYNTDTNYIALLSDVPEKLSDLTDDLGNSPTHTHSQYLTSHQDISGKADKVTSATNGNFASLDSNGNLTDSGHKHSDYLTSFTETDPVFSASAAYGITASDITTWNKRKAQSIPLGHVDSTSVATAFTATVNGITALEDGVCCYLSNTVVASAAATTTPKCWTLNINGLGAKPVYVTTAAATYSTTQFAKNYKFLFVYDTSLNSGNGGWYIGILFNTNTTYAVLSQSEINAGTSTTGRSISAKILRDNFYTEGEVNTLLGNKQDTSNLVTSLSSSSTDTEYPSAKCVWDMVGDIETVLASI